MNYSTNAKPMTIKEYKKNYYKVHAKELSGIDKDKDNLNQSQSILLYKIFKNKKLHSYILNSSANKTTQSFYQKQENRKKAIKIDKKKKYDINNTSQVSPFKNRAPGESPTFFIGNLKDISYKKIENSQQNKSYNNLNIYYKNTNDKNKSNENILHDSYFTNKKYNDKTTTKSKKNINSCKTITPLTNIRNKKLNESGDERNNENKNNKYEAIYKNKDNSHFFYHSKNNHSKSQKELSTINKFKDLKYPKKNNANLNYNINTKKSKYIKAKNNYLTSAHTSKAKGNVKINFPKDNKNYKNLNNNINSLNISVKREFNNLQKKKVELFTINNIKIKENEKNKPEKEDISNLCKLCFKNFEQEKCINLFFKNQNKKKTINNKDKEKNINKNKDNYTGFVLTKKKMGNIEEEIKIKDNIENIKTIFLNLLNDISDSQLEFITTKELTSLKSEINENINIINDLEKEKNENILKASKIKEQEEIIKKKEEEFFDYQVEFLELQSEFEKLKTENNKMKEKLNSMEKESKKIMEDNSKLKDEYIKYKNKKDEKMNNEIKDLEGKIKKYKEELKKNNNNIKNNFNLGENNSKIKRMSVTYNFRFDTMLNNLEKKKNENKNKGPNANSILSKLVIIDEKKILEDKEEIEEIEEKKIENENNEKEKEEVVNKINNEINIIKDNNEINENKIQQPIINNDSNTHINNNEIESKMVSNMNNNQVVQLTDNAKDTKNDTININDNNKNDIIKTNDGKEKKMSKALNRFRKKMSQAQPNIPPKNYANERSHSCAKRSEKINGIARMLEQQMGRRDEKIELNEENRAATDDETDRELDIVKLIEKKPTYGGKKRKPTLKNKFNKEPVDE